MIEKLLLMLRDADYRVRLCFAQRVGVLFQTWDGHFELFQDIWYDAWFSFAFCCIFTFLVCQTN